MDSILTDVRYALGQLRRIVQAADGPRVADSAARAIDALERVEEACIGAETVDLAEIGAEWSTDEILTREG